MPSAEEFSIILLDDTCSQEAPPPLLEKLQIIANICYRYTTVDQCNEYIKNTKENILLVITNGKNVKTLLTECIGQKHLKSIYVLDEKAMLITDSRVAYFADSISLLQQIESDIEPLKQHLVAFRFFHSNQKTMRDLTSEAASFMWSQMLIDVLRQIPLNARTMDDMLAMCKDYYHENSEQLKSIDEFRRTYKPYMAIKWYTRDSFLFRLLNKAIRTEDTDALYLFRAFIVDLCSQLEEEQRVHSFSTMKFTVYHGQCMYVSELNELKANIGHLVSTNAFFSTSLSEDVAKIYAERDPHVDARESVIIKIDVNTRLRHTVFARIDNDRLSHVPDECEVLFSLSAVFKIINVCQERNQDRWTVHLEATDEGREILDEYRRLSKLDAENTNIEIDFGRLLMNMGQHSKAIKYFTSLAARFDVNDIAGRATIIAFHSTCLYVSGKYDEAQQFLENGLAWLNEMRVSPTNVHYLRCRFHLANVHVFKGNFELARIIFEEILREQERTLPPTHIHIADTIRGIGWVHGRESGYDQSLPYIERALRIYEQTLPDNHPKRIGTLYALGGAYEALNKWDLALQYLNQTLKAQERYFPGTHTSIAETLRGIGGIYDVKGDWDMALHYYFRALDIWMQNFPQGHLLISNCLTMIGSAYRSRKQLTEALKYQTCAIEMRQKLFPPGTRYPQLGLARTYLDMGDNEKAIELLLSTCDYWKEKTKNPSNTFLHSAQSCLATAYSHDGQLQLAQEIYEQVLTAQRKVHPNGNDDTALTLHHMGSNLRRMKEFARAMQCYQESLNILLQFFEPDHYQVTRVNEKIRHLEQQMDPLAMENTSSP